jgi:hypothetical protein
VRRLEGEKIKAKGREQRAKGQRIKMNIEH